MNITLHPVPADGAAEPSAALPPPDPRHYRRPGTLQLSALPPLSPVSYTHLTLPTTPYV